MENENQEITHLTVMEKPALSEQVITAAVGSVATILASVVISTGVQAVQNYRQNRKAKKMAQEHIETPEED